MVAKVQRPDCQTSQLCRHVVPFCVNYFNLSRNLNVHLSEPCTLEFCTMGKMCPGFLRKRVLECEGLQGYNGIFLYIYKYYTFQKKLKKEKRKKNKKITQEQLLQVQPAVTKNVVSIFIEVLYRSRVENIYYLNYFTGKKGQGFVES